MAPPVRVMFLVGSLSTGGAERFVSNVVNRIDRAIFKPFLALYRATVTYPLAPDVEVNVLGKYHPWDNLRAAWRFARWIDQIRPDLVLSAWSVPNVFTAETLRWTRHRPFWLARIASDPAAEERGVYGQWARNSYKRADGFLAVSWGLAAAFESRYPFATNRVQVVCNGVDPTELGGHAVRPIMLEPQGVVHAAAVGRLHRDKRFDVMLRALAEARRSVDVHLNVLGDGPEGRKLKQLAAHLGISEAISWHGFQPDPHAYLARADIFLSTSDHEGMSNALLEAQAMGLPAVVTDCAFGNAEIVVNGETGIVVPIRDVAEVTRAIIQLAQSPEERARMGRAAAERVARHFSIEATVSKVEQVFLQSIQWHGSS